jgi:hypothetical protein
VQSRKGRDREDFLFFIFLNEKSRQKPPERRRRSKTSTNDEKDDLRRFRESTSCFSSSRALVRVSFPSRDIKKRKLVHDERRKKDAIIIIIIIVLFRRRRRRNNNNVSELDFIKDGRIYGHLGCDDERVRVRVVRLGRRISRAETFQEGDDDDD